MPTYREFLSKVKSEIDEVEKNWSTLSISNDRGLCRERDLIS